MRLCSFHEYPSSLRGVLRPQKRLTLRTQGARSGCRAFTGLWAEAGTDACLPLGNRAGCWATRRRKQCSCLWPDWPPQSSVPSFGSRCPRFKLGGGLDRPQGAAGVGLQSQPPKVFATGRTGASPCLGRADAQVGPPRGQWGTILQSEEHKGPARTTPPEAPRGEHLCWSQQAPRHPSHQPTCASLPPAGPDGQALRRKDTGKLFPPNETLSGQVKAREGNTVWATPQSHSVPCPGGAQRVSSMVLRPLSPV